MKLAIVPLVVLILLVSSLCVTLNVVQASTDVRGTIDSNRTWTSSGSPYSLSAPVTVASGVTLTIQPGVIVQLNGFILTVNGTLTVNQATIDGGWTIGDRFFGTKEEHTGSVIFRETSSGSSITGSNLKQPSIIVNGDLKFSGNSLSGVGMAVYSGYPEISKNTFTDSRLGVQNGSPLITQNIFHSNGGLGVAIHIDGGSPQIYSNILYVGFQGIYMNGNGEASIRNNIIANYSQGIVGSLRGKVVVEGNLVMNNGAGMCVSSMSIQHNTFAFNRVAAINSTYSPSNINYNNFEESNANAVSLAFSSNEDATNNWWGTTDAQAIGDSIYDGNDYYNLGTVNFTPFLTAPDSQAPSVSAFSTANPLPLPSITPTTPNPTQNPIPTETETQTSPPTFTFTLSPDALWSIIAALSIVIIALALTLALVLRYRKPRNLFPSKQTQSSNPLNISLFYSSAFFDSRLFGS